MIAIVMLAFGLFAVVGLQLQMLRFSQSANVPGRLVLVKQIILAGVIAKTTDFTAFCLTSNRLVSYSAQKGWYLDLPTSTLALLQGERVIFNPVTRAGR